ncbi:citrate-binding protein-like [Aegilops tauschii subsp. strangulata]|uniref:citrate-binding protein-like n=1 Tax=Aegilops tauschii subsp. strangulata TaxID=200361 RepID=UPI00098A0F30|nr:citrate-binding protein-like [Aegilops tauschii subsp. strangulata]
MGTAVVIGMAHAGDPLTAGFTPVRLTESQFVVQRPYDVPLDARYEFAGGVRRMWAYSTDKPMSATHPGGARTETKIDQVYRSGVWQFAGEVYVPAGTSGACIMQIFGAAPKRQATTLMLHVYDGRLTFYHDLRRVLAGGVYDRWLRLNVVHDVGARNVTVFVDGAEVLRSRSHGAPGAPHYFKFGVYKQSHHHPSDRMESRWRNVRVFTKH